MRVVDAEPLPESRASPDLRPHDARHLYAVNLVQAGVPLTTVGALLGHSPRSIAVTMRYARHAPRNAAEMALERLERRLASSSGS